MSVRTPEETAIKGGQGAVIVSLVQTEKNQATSPPAAGAETRDRQIVVWAETRLWMSNYRFGLSPQNVSCQYDDGTLILKGRVSTYYLKQVAQTLVAGIDGIKRIDNQIEVRTPQGLQPRERM